MKQGVIRIGLLDFGTMDRTHAFAVSSMPRDYCRDLLFHPIIRGVTTGSAKKRIDKVWERQVSP